MKKKIIVTVTAVVVLLAFLLGLETLRNRKTATFRTTGAIEGTEVNVSSMITGRILKKYCREGDTVRKGQVLIELESDELKAAMAQAEAGIEKAGADVRVTASIIESARANRAGADAGIADVAAEVEKARAGMEEKKRELDRYEALFQNRIVPKATYDVALTAYETAAADHRSATAKLAAAKSKKKAAGAELRTAENQFKAARANLKEAEAGHGVIKAKLEQTIITSPISGVVVFNALEAGESASPGNTILTLVDLTRLYVRIDVEETLIGGMAMGRPVIVRSDDVANMTFAGKIAQISRYAEFATQKDVTRGRQDIRTFKIKIDVENPGGYLKPGMTVEVEMPLQGAP